VNDVNAVNDVTQCFLPAFLLLGLGAANNRRGAQGGRHMPGPYTGVSPRAGWPRRGFAPPPWQRGSPFSPHGGANRPFAPGPFAGNRGPYGNRPRTGPWGY
jgi:hypothetical protein